MAPGPDDQAPDVVSIGDVELIEGADEALARGRELFLAGALADAAAAFAEAAAADPTSAEARHGLAKALGRTDPRAARAALEEAVALRPDGFEAWRALTLLLRAQGDDAAADRAMAKALDAAPGPDARALAARDLAPRR